MFILVFFILICFLAAGIGGFFTSKSIPDWYTHLQKPVFTPPGWIFGPVWSLLYLSIGISAWLIWREGGFSQNSVPLIIFGIQLLLNISWSIIFFGLRQPGYAFGEIILLWLAILLTLVTFWRIKPIAGILLIPYLVWVSFAGFLNYSIWKLNPL